MFINSAFKYCDKDNDQCISENDIQDVLNQGMYYATEKEIKYLINKFSHGRSAYINYVDFIDELTPKVKT